MPSLPFRMLLDVGRAGGDEAIYFRVNVVAAEVDVSGCRHARVVGSESLEQERDRARVWSYQRLVLRSRRWLRLPSGGCGPELQLVRELAAGASRLTWTTLLR